MSSGTVTWVGINDCASVKLRFVLYPHTYRVRPRYATEETVPKYLEILFDLQEDQLEDGARNFLFIDVPPVHRSPSGM